MNPLLGRPGPTGPGDAETAPPEQAEPSRPPQFGGQQFTPTTPQSEGDGYVSSRPLLMVGAAGAIVAELAHALEAAGYPNKIAAGEAQPVLDDELMRLVQQFQDDQGIAPHRPQGEAAPLVPGRDRHSGVVDALTWQALGLARPVLPSDRYPVGTYA